MCEIRTCEKKGKLVCSVLYVLLSMLGVGVLCELMSILKVDVDIDVEGNSYLLLLLVLICLLQTFRKSLF